MSSNLAKVLTNLKIESTQNKCGVCNAIRVMDKETKEAFIDVMNSEVSIKAIVDALIQENVGISRFLLGETRRECIRGARQCPVFKGDKK